MTITRVCETTGSHHGGPKINQFEQITRLSLQIDSILVFGSFIRRMKIVDCKRFEFSARLHGGRWSFEIEIANVCAKTITCIVFGGTEGVNVAVASVSLRFSGIPAQPVEPHARKPLCA